MYNRTDPGMSDAERENAAMEETRYRAAFMFNSVNISISCVFSLAHKKVVFLLTVCPYVHGGVGRLKFKC